LLGPYVSAPDPRSGLIRVSLRRFYGENYAPQLFGPGRSVAAHELKEDEEYEQWYERILRARATGGRAVWPVPDELRLGAQGDRMWMRELVIAALGTSAVLVSGLYSRKGARVAVAWRSCYSMLMSRLSPR
jgi:hypothetical protein